MHSPTIALFALLATACHGFTVVPAARSATIASSRRTTTVSANFFDDLKKVAEYNTKFIGTAMSSMFDDRTATASHILFGFAKYNDGQFQANALKERIEAGEISFADAAKEFSTCPSSAKGGDLGSFKKGAMVPEFDAVCFDENVPLGDAKISGPIKTQFGHHLIAVYERSAAK